MAAKTYKDSAQNKAAADNGRVWYAPDRRIKTQAAAGRAIEISHRIAGGRWEHENRDEQELFRALHACAYRATRRPGRRGNSTKERSMWAKRWELIRDHVVERNMPLVHSMMGRFDARGLDHDDILSEAMFALVQAVERFDPWRGFRFSTYACLAIHRAMIRSSKSTSRYRRLFPVQHDASFERPEEPANGDGLHVERLRRVLDGNLGRLTDLESAILFKRFPRTREECRLTLQQIGKAVGLSKERVRQIQNEALGKLRAILEADLILR